MIEHVYRRAADAVDAVVVATDDRRIADAVESFGGIARMTSRAHRTGTDRIAEVAADLDCAIIVNPQGDEPLASHGHRSHCRGGRRPRLRHHREPAG